VGGVAQQTLTFKPNANVVGNGLASFGFHVQDTNTGSFPGVDTETPVNAHSISINVLSVNDEPVARAGVTVTAPEDRIYTFSRGDFASANKQIFDPGDFAGASPNAAGGDNFLNLIVTALPAKGTLTANGIPVTVNTPISVLNIIDTGKLIYT